MMYSAFHWLDICSRTQARETKIIGEQCSIGRRLRCDMNTTLSAVGICLGASTVTIVRIGVDRPGIEHASTFHSRPQILEHHEYPHDGNPKATLVHALKCIPWDRVQRVAVTGRKFRQWLNLSTIPEPEAVEYAYRHIRPADVRCPAVISAGGETFMVYVLDASGQIANVLTGNKCAAGTGEFFLQQLRRMDVNLDEAAQWAAGCEPYHVSGRCSVFCKSDCTHATNKGIPRARVTAGLGKMMANKILELLKKVEPRNLMLTGGTARNQMMVHYLRQAIPGLIVPPEGIYFEALGAALWALENPTRPFPGLTALFARRQRRFDTLAPLAQFEPMVTFKSIPRDEPQPGDVCLLGLDVGSTTTKAVLVRKDDQALLASVYLRTNGDPVGASRHCYRALLAQIEERFDAQHLRIIGLGVCGSGRQIAGLHALTEGVINEIIAHATAAVYFDREVDTIFEIGGQDAKYTYITNGVPSDYAMNEACSAGTGSFLEESALETLNVPMEQIADQSLKGLKPPNFNDQCAAFISSDIKNAIHEGIGREDIIAGLVYSICMNYNNRVKGNRPVGKKVFMQGGVCYNRAIPLAMAALTGKAIVVPPEPGLMGAFGAALEVSKRLSAGLMQPAQFDLAQLAEREVAYGRTFTCKGGKEGCDRRCEITRIGIDGQLYPFGGACNRYENLRRNRHFDIASLDLVRLRQELVFTKYAPPPLDPRSKTYRGRVGFNRSFLVNTYYPLYAHFFSACGYDPVLPDIADQSGIDQRNAPFCYPAELAHGFFHCLIHGPTPPDILFLPHFRAVPSLNGSRSSQVCPLVQGEPFYLQTTFRRHLNQLKEHGMRLLSPLLDLTAGLAEAREPLVESVVQLGVARRTALKAFDSALAVMTACQEEMYARGRDALNRLAGNPDEIGIVLVSRPYNGFVSEAHKGIPHKFASRGVLVIPMDFLDIADQPDKRFMYWGMGQRILRAAHKIKAESQLFGTYITNFSCGPDSFLIGYFRDMMGRKPSLTLELDSHTADAGLETRIEAFLDIVHAYRKLAQGQRRSAAKPSFEPARTVSAKNDVLAVITSQGRTLPYTHPNVTLLFPSMGALGTTAVSAAFASIGFNVHAHEPNNEAILKLGRANTSCKECLPLLLTTGTLLDYVQHHRKKDEVVIYFMPTGSGPCRFGQYHIFMEDLIKKMQVPDVAVFSLSSDNNYAGLPTTIHRRAWWAIVLSDVFEDMRAMLLANAREPETAMSLFQETFRDVLEALKGGTFDILDAALIQAARRLRAVALNQPVAHVPVIAITGEIFVRRDGLSRQFLTEYLAERGFATICAPVAEWVLYTDYLLRSGFYGKNHISWRGKMAAALKRHVMSQDERRIKSRLAASGLVHGAPLNIDKIVATASPYISPRLGGEAILTVGSSMLEVAVDACGVIAIGPFGCMPNRISEAILNETMKREDKLSCDEHNHQLRNTLSQISDLPFLAIESDGSAFPQLIHAKLESFCLRAERLHERMLANKYAN
jgi:predicted CoA-substrate-specific enzyme activase